MMVRVYRNTLHNESQGDNCIFFIFVDVFFESESSSLTFFGLKFASVFNYIHMLCLTQESWSAGNVCYTPWKPVYPFASSLAGLHIIFSDADLFCCSKIGHLKISRLGQTIDSF